MANTIKYSLSKMSSQPGTVKSQITEHKFYADVQTQRMETGEFVAHVADHGSSFSRGTLNGALCDLVDCMRHELLDGKRVALGDLGEFYCSVSSTGERKAEDFTSKNITGVKVIYVPGPRFQELLKDASFEFVASREAQAAAKKAAKEDGSDTGSEDGKTNVD